MRAALAAAASDALSSQALLPGLSAVFYGLASLSVVFLNKEILDLYRFPSTSLLLFLQLSATLALAAAAYAGWRATGAHKQTRGADRSAAARSAAPPLALLFLGDVALGHVASRALGLDAFAAFRRLSIPLALHLELWCGQADFNGPVAAAAWAMVSGPMLGLFFGRGKAAEATAAVAAVPSEALGGAAAVAQALRGDGAATLDRRVPRNGTSLLRHRVSGKRATKLARPSAGAAFFDAFSAQGCVAAVASAVVVAGRVVYLKRVLDDARDDADESDAGVIPEDAVGLLFDAKGEATLRSGDGRPAAPRNPAAGLAAAGPHGFAGALLARTTALCLPAVALLGVVLDFGALARARRLDAWSDAAFVSRFGLLVAVAGPVHEVAVYLCVLHNSALTTLVAGAFKSTALAAYHAVVASAIAGEPPQDAWDALGMAITALASLVYTVEWFKLSRRRKHGLKHRAASALWASPTAGLDRGLRWPRRADAPAWRSGGTRSPSFDSLMLRRGAHHRSAENLAETIFGA